MKKIFSKELETAIEAAKKGSEVALSYFGKSLAVEMKNDKSPVTIADPKTESAIREVITKEFPDAQFVGEEMGGSFEKKEFWTIDPIDGTKNFMRGINLWSILIAYYKEGKFQLGVSYEPAINELLYAERGKGAYLNDQRVYVSNISYLEEASVCRGETRYFEDPTNVFLLSHKVLSERGIGDAWSYHLLATGKVEAMFEAYTHVWDVAPFSVIVEEAGGKFTNMQGKEWTLSDTNVLATNGILHDEIARLVNKKNT